jgi:hypothetical protein
MSLKDIPQEIFDDLSNEIYLPPPNEADGREKAKSLGISVGQYRRFYEEVAV